MQTNILNEALKECSCNPLTGFFRDGLCRASKEDLASHTVCAVMTKEFLEYSKSKGNDLITAIEEFNFPGLKEGDMWCLCASRWKEAYEANVAPYVIAEATSINALGIIDSQALEEYYYKK